MILDTIVLNRRKQLRELEESTPLSTITQRAFDYNDRFPVRDFGAALKKPGISVIAEVKKASPSKGVISADFHPVETALEYERGGADAISVLTEETYFQGRAEYLTGIKTKTARPPVLRKDFIVDEWQICESRLIGADAILLITAALKYAELRRLIEVAGMLSLQCLVETRSREEIDAALRAGAKIIGVNNRNLGNFAVDLDTAVQLGKMIPKGTVFVAESGIKTREDVKRMEEAGADAVLIGETLMRAASVPVMISELKGRAYGPD